MYSSINKDAGCPNQCMSENDYNSINGAGACPVECMSGYANPSSTIACPANCNYYEVYSTVGGMYDMYIPASTKSRLIGQQSVTDDFQVQNSRITNFTGNVLNVLDTSNLQTGATTTNVLSLLSQLEGVNRQLVAATKSAQDGSKVAQDAANSTSVVLANQGPATAANNVNTAVTAANNASSDAAAATNLASQVSGLADRISEAVKGLPQTPEIQNAIQSAMSSKTNAASLSDAANAAAAAAQSAAAQSAAIVSGGAAKAEGFRFRGNGNGLKSFMDSISKKAASQAAIHNRLRYRQGYGSYVGM
jgi:hypothetical protein